MANLDSMPAEIVSIIFDNISTCGCNDSSTYKCRRGKRLKSAFNLRLTSKKFGIIGARNIVETIHLCFRKKSFQNLENISRHELLRGHVKRIIYDTDALLYMSRSFWERCIPIPRHHPLPPDFRCMAYSQDKGVTYMPNKHWERCDPNFPSNLPLPSDVVIPPYACPPNFESEPFNPELPDYIPAIDRYNRTRKRWMKKLVPRLIYSEEELDKGYECFKKEVKDNLVFFMKNNLDYSILAVALKRFPQLKEVSIVALSDEVSCSEDLKANFKHTLIFPHKFARENRAVNAQFPVLLSFRQAESMLRAIVSSGVHLKVLNCGYLLWIFFLEIPLDRRLGQISPELCLPAFIHLTQINLKICAYEYGYGSRAKHSLIGQAIGSAQNLTSLSLSFHDDYPRQRKNLSLITWDSIAAKTTWPHLSELSLSTVATTGDFWINFLRRHSTTLVSLELDEVFLIKGSWLNVFSRMKSIVEATNVLRNAKFLGGFFDSEYEDGEEVDETGLNMTFSKFDDLNQLGSKLANFLIHNHENPLSILHGDDDEDDDNDVYARAYHSYDDLDRERYRLHLNSDTASQNSYDEMDLGSELDSDEEIDRTLFRGEYIEIADYL